MLYSEKHIIIHVFALSWNESLNEALGLAIAKWYRAGLQVNWLINLSCNWGTLVTTIKGIRGTVLRHWTAGQQVE